VSPRIAWASFVSTRIAEPELESVRLRLLRLNTDSKEAFDQALQSLIAELRGRQAEVARYE